MSYTNSIEYFEEGCLCVLTGRIEKTLLVGEEGCNYYMSNCTCTRHPERNREDCWDSNRVERMKAINMIRKKTHA